MLKIFLSSTARDLKDHRQKVFEAIQRLGKYHCVRMEDFGAQPQSALEFCRAQVRECHLFVGIMGHLYGSSYDATGVSYTEDEYDMAEAAELPRLMFLAPDDFPMPKDLWERETDEQRRRQKAFRDRVTKELIRDSFVTADDLAGRVLAVISRWEDQQEQRPSPPTAPPQRMALNPEGEFIPNMCDRKLQDGAFKLFFPAQLKQRPGFPQVYVLPGEEAECPGILVERLTRVSIKQYLASRSRSADRDIEVTSKKVEWPERVSPGERQKHLAAALFRAFDKRHEFQPAAEFTPAAFVRLTSLMQEPVVVLRHTVQLSHWDGETKTLLDWYLRYWDEVGAIASKPLFIVFLIVHHPPATSESRWRSLLGLSGFDRNRIQKEMGAVLPRWLKLPEDETERNDRLGLLFKELPCIRRDDVREWMDEYEICDEADRRKKCDTVIREGDCLHFEDVKPELDRLFCESINKRGWA